MGLSIAQLTSAPRQGVGAYIQFLINEFAIVQVVAEDENCWVLVTGRIAKRAEGSSWFWALDEEHFEPEHLEYLLSRVSVQETEGVDTPRVSSSSYSFGNWGYHTNDHDSELMPGFSSTPPGAEICGHYKVVYIAALPTIFDGEVSLPAEGSRIDRYFGPGYKFYGFEANSEANLNYNSRASNACLIVTKRNDNKGRLYRVDQPKAFKLVDSEGGVVANESASFDSQEHESMEARRSCKCRHFSFLCRELGLPCSASALITSYVRHQPFFNFAEPGVIWIDIRLSTPVRTYVLARRERPDLDAQSVPAGLAENFPHGL